MAIEVKCTSCGKKHAFADKYKGRQGECKSCGHALTIRNPSAEHAGGSLTPELKHRDSGDKAIRIHAWVSEAMLMWVYPHEPRIYLAILPDDPVRLRQSYDYLRQGQKLPPNALPPKAVNSFAFNQIRRFFVEDRETAVIFKLGSKRDVFFADSVEEARQVGAELGALLKVQARRVRTTIAEASILPCGAFVMAFLFSGIITFVGFKVAAGEGGETTRGKAKAAKALLEMLGPNAGWILLGVGTVVSGAALLYWIWAVAKRGMQDLYLLKK